MHIEDLPRHLTTIITQLTDIQKRLTAIERRLASLDGVSPKASDRPRAASVKVEKSQQYPPSILMSIPQAMDHLGISRIKIYERIKKGHFVPVKIGRSTRIRRSELEAFADGSLPE